MAFSHVWVPSSVTQSRPWSEGAVGSACGCQGTGSVAVTGEFFCLLFSGGKLHNVEGFFCS